jgi:hypothetical protein
MDEWLLERANQLAEIEERLQRILDGQRRGAGVQGLLLDLHDDVRKWVADARAEFHAF